MKIIIAGPSYPYRGGIADFNERLAAELKAQGHEVKIYTFTLQYPSFLFPGKTQYSTGPAPQGLDIVRTMNSVNPFSWIRSGRRIKKESPDLVIVSYWMPYMAPCLGTVSRLAGRKCHVAGLVHNLLPHEKKPFSEALARYFCKSVDRFVALSDSVAGDILKMSEGKPVRVCPHPVYDNFGDKVDSVQARQILGLPCDCNIILSFGLIRDYKGIDWLMEAFSRLQDKSSMLVIAGEFYSNKEKYLSLSKELGIQDRVIFRSTFIPQEQVRYYFSAADLIAQTYKSATQSGVTQIAYHFEKPMLVTNVGGLGEIVPDGVAGYVVDPDVDSITDGLKRFLEQKPDFSKGLSSRKELFSWVNMAKAFTD